MTEQDDITDMKKCRTGRRWMAGLLLGLESCLQDAATDKASLPMDPQKMVKHFKEAGLI